MKLPSWLRIGACWVVGCCLFACLPEEKVSGTSTDSGNAITIAGVINEGKMPAARVVVTLYPNDFNPTQDVVPDSLRDTTGNDGKYLFKVSEQGRYNIEAVRIESHTVALVTGIELIQGNTKVTAPPANLSMPGTLILYPQDINFQPGSRLYIPGTDVFSTLDSSNLKLGIVPVLQVPEAKFAVVRYSRPQIQTDVNILSQEISIYPQKASTLSGNVDSALIGTWFSTAPKGWSLDTVYIDENSIKVPGLQVYGGLSFTARNGLMTDWLGKVAVEYLLVNDTLYTEMQGGFPADGVVDKSNAKSFIKISKTIPVRPL